MRSAGQMLLAVMLILSGRADVDSQKAYELAVRRYPNIGEATRSVSCLGAFDAATDEIRLIPHFLGRVDLPFDRGWLFLVDDAPKANWSHPCRYLFVSADARRIVVQSGENPVEICRKGEDRTSIPARLFRKRLSSTASVEKTGQWYAVLISGGLKKSSNHIRYWGDMALAYNMLRKRFGLPRENITVLWASGDPSADLCQAAGGSCGTCSGAKVPANAKDFDRDGVDDIDGPASPERTVAVFEELKRTLTGADRLFVFVTDHGGKYAKSKAEPSSVEPFSYINLWDGGHLTDAALSGLTRDISCPVAFALETCYSGGFVADLLLSDHARFVATATRHAQSTAGMSHPWYDQWALHFLSALNGAYPKDGRNPQEDGKSCVADENGDGRVSLREAARFACRTDIVFDTPQYAESPPGAGSALFLSSVSEPIDGVVGGTTYAGFRSNYKLELGANARLSNGDLSYEGPRKGIKEFARERFLLEAAERTIDSAQMVWQFDHWKTTPSVAKLGSEFDASSAQTVFVMPAAATVLTPVYVEALDTVPIHGVTGCRLAIALDVENLVLPVEFKLEGKLPAGVKFDKKTGVFSGTPTARKGGSARVVVTMKDAVGTVRRLAVRLAIDPLPDELTGDYRALLTHDGSDVFEAIAEVSIPSSGKVSGKLVRPSGATSFTAAMSQDAFGRYVLSMTAPSVKKAEALASFDCVMNVGGGDAVFGLGKAGDRLSGQLRKAVDSASADEIFRSKFFSRYYTLSLAPRRFSGRSIFACRKPDELSARGYLTLKTDAKGGARLAGVLADGESVSLSAPLLFDDEAHVVIRTYAVPSSYGKNGFLSVELLADEFQQVSGECHWRFPAVRTSEAGLLSLAMEGREYVKATDDQLTAVSLYSKPIDLTYEYQSKSSTGKRTLETALNVEFSCGTLGWIDLIGGKGTLSMPESPAPWKDGSSSYNYAESKPDRKGVVKDIVNPARATLSYKNSTGVFSGKFNVYFDYLTPSFVHKAISVPYSGVVVLMKDGERIGYASGKYSYKITENKKKRSFLTSIPIEMIFLK